MENIPCAIGANAPAALNTIGEPQDNSHRLPLGGPTPSPAFQQRPEREGSTSVNPAGGRSGRDGVTVGATDRRNFPRKFSVPQKEDIGSVAEVPVTAEREEQQLMASIARLDALLKDDRVLAGKSHPSHYFFAASKSCAKTEDGGVAQPELPQSGARERKPARSGERSGGRSGGIAKTRIRKGSRKEIEVGGRAQAARAVPLAPRDDSSTSATVPTAKVPAETVPGSVLRNAIVPAPIVPTSTIPVAETSTATTRGPVVFPPLVRRETGFSDETTDRGRHLNGIDGSEQPDRDTRSNNGCRKDGRLLEPRLKYNGPVSPPGAQNTDGRLRQPRGGHNGYDHLVSPPGDKNTDKGRLQNTDQVRGGGGRDWGNPEVNDCYRQRDRVTPGIDDFCRPRDGNDNPEANQCYRPRDGRDNPEVSSCYRPRDGRDNTEVSGCYEYRPRDVIRSSFTPACREVEHDQYGSGDGARALRHPNINRSDEEWTEMIPSAPMRYQDARCRNDRGEATYHDDRVDVRYRDDRGKVADEYLEYDGYDPRGGVERDPGGEGGRAGSYHRRIEVSPRNGWEARAERGRWEGEPPRKGDHFRHDRNTDGRTEHNRCRYPAPAY